MTVRVFDKRAKREDTKSAADIPVGTWFTGSVGTYTNALCYKSQYGICVIHDLGTTAPQRLTAMFTGLYEPVTNYRKVDVDIMILEPFTKSPSHE